MTTLVLLLTLVMAIGVGVAVMLNRLLRAGSSRPLAESAIVATVGSGLQTYQPMNRLFAEEDFHFLAGLPQGEGLRTQLRRQRQRVLRLYLRELRADFERLYGWCRQLAPRSQDPNFATLITQQAAAFYGLLLVVHVRSTLGWFLPVRVDAGELVRVFDQLRQAARVSLPVAQPA